eukprot:528792_1
MAETACLKPCSGTNCKRKATSLKCPICVKLNLPASYWCSQYCFKQNYRFHNNTVHKNVKTTGEQSSTNTTTLEILHNHCIGRSVFTEICIEIPNATKKEQNQTETLLQNSVKNIPDVFVYKNRVIIASTNPTSHRRIYLNKINIPIADQFQKTQYHVKELLYSNGYISNKGVTFLDKNKTVQNSTISDLFTKVPFVFKDAMDELIVFGYTRQACKEIPNELQETCLLYYRIKDQFSVFNTSDFKMVGENKIVSCKSLGWCDALGKLVLIHLLIRIVIDGFLVLIKCNLIGLSELHRKEMLKDCLYMNMIIQNIRIMQVRWLEIVIKHQLNIKVNHCGLLKVILFIWSWIAQPKHSHLLSMENIRAV